MKYLFLSVIIVLTSYSCKKKDSAEPIESTMGGPVFSSSVYGSLQTLAIQAYSGNTFAYNDSTASANFYASPISAGSVTYVNAGTVSYNGTQLKKSSSFYSDTTHLINIHQSGAIWNVAGSADVPTFTFAVTPSYPSFTGNVNLPDSISLSNNLTINLTGVSNCNSGIGVTLSDGVNYKTKSIIVPSTTCSFSSAELSAFSPTTNAYIIVTFSNGVFNTFSGKKYYFDYVLQHDKLQIKLKP
jgi:hypothetical protein